jgi:hypothetical protein
MIFIPSFIGSMIIWFLSGYLHDDATFRNCATKGEAVMLSGGKIKCEVEKNVPVQVKTVPN